jgi:hypothetical protein
MNCQQRQAWSCDERKVMELQPSDEESIAAAQAVATFVRSLAVR